MGNYNIVFKSSVLNDLKKIEKSRREKILKIINKLSNNAFPAGVKKLTGTENLYRIRSGDYRIIYKIFDKTIIIYYIRHRKDVYRFM